MKRCLLIVNTFKDDASVLAASIKEFLDGEGIQSALLSYDGKSPSKQQLDEAFDKKDFVITLGGDGTVLFASRSCAERGIPVLAINLGEFGFLAGTDCDFWKHDVERFLAGNCEIGSRSLVSCEVLRDGRTVFSAAGLNDVVVSSVASARLINLNVAYNHAVLGPFKANGLIVSTPTGSTAYSAAAGGPIIDPLLDALVLTPISSFSLSARPLVFSARGEIAITVLPSRERVGLSVDGQVDCALQTKDVIILGVPEYKAQLICSTQEKFYVALQSKLNWAGGPRA